jgi:response regulator of citrate/malate metabolism
VYISEYILVDILNHLLDSKGINTIAKLNVAVAKLDYKEIIHHTEVIHKYFKSWDYKFPIQTFRFSILSEALLFYSNKNETIKENIEYVKALGKLDTLLILEQSVEAPGNGHIN